ncbi:YtzI protein [Bacillus seohaeanensis]|jgi:hypothetical protein|uniref:YtzI protein n=1 Tax=Bacillus seohaeanensis TaxID=284580 RepID=A0ABW5RVR3_9BACI
MALTIVMILAVIICIVTIAVSVLTTSKAYTSVKHTIDPIENNPHLENKKTEEDKNNHVS